MSRATLNPARFALEGITVHYKYLSWKRGYAQAQKGATDGTLVWSRSPEREQSFYFSDPIVPGKDVCFCPTTSPIEWNQPVSYTHLTLPTKRIV